MLDMFINNNWKKIKSIADICKLNSDTLVIKLHGFINNSGFALKQLCNYLNINYDYKLWILHDDMDFAFGDFKIHQSRRSGHNGIRNILQVQKEFHARISIGIGEPAIRNQNSMSAYALANFTKDEQMKLKNVSLQIYSELSKLL